MSRGQERPIRLAQEPYRGGWHRDDQADSGWDYRPQGTDLADALGRSPLSHGVLGEQGLQALFDLVAQTFPEGHPMQQAWEAAMTEGDPLALRQVLDALQDEGADLGPVLQAARTYPRSAPGDYLPGRAEEAARNQARLGSVAESAAWDHRNEQARWESISPRVGPADWDHEERLRALLEGPEEPEEPAHGQGGRAAWAQRARDFLARVGHRVGREVGLAFKSRAQLDREWEAEMARTQARYAPPAMREPRELPADDPMSAESVGRLRDSLRVTPNPTGQPPQRDYSTPPPPPLGGVSQYNPGPLDPPARYAGTHSPAGGVVVRGLYYPGGKFIPGKAAKGGHEMDKGTLDQYQSIQSQRAQYSRREDGSSPPVEPAPRPRPGGSYHPKTKE